MTTKHKKSDAMKLLEKIAGGPLTLGKALRAARMCDEMTQEDFSSLLGISRAHLCDIEMERRRVSPERAAKFARILGRLEAHWVELALQDELTEAGLALKVHVSA